MTKNPASVLFGLVLCVQSCVAYAQRNPATERTLITAPSSTQERFALVIGNSSYRESPLRNPVNDARDIAEKVEKLGFRTTVKLNSNQTEMKQAIRQFGSELRRGGVGLFYFAGHGLQIRGSNYLVPVNADIQAEADAEDQSVDVNLVLRYMEDAKNGLNILILDACRNNPFARSFRSAERGLAQMSAATGTLIAFATAPGSVAADGEGRNGLYTQYLLKSLDHPDTDVLKVFQRVRAGVHKDSGGRQTPWESTSLLGDFYFRPPQTLAGHTATVPTPPASTVSALPAGGSIAPASPPALMAAIQRPSAMTVPAGTSLLIGTGGTGGVYYPFGKGLANVLTKNVSGLQAFAEVTAGSVANLQLLSAGKTAIGFVLADAAYDARQGLGRFQGKVGAMALAALYPNSLHVVAAQGRIDSISDLRGSIVSTGSPGSATEVVAMRVLEAYGVTERDIRRERLGIAESAEALRNGRIHAFFWLGGVPTFAIADLANVMGKRVKLVDHADVVERLNRKFGPIYSRGLIPAGSYPQQERGSENVQLWNLLVADERLPDAVAYNVVKVLSEQQAELVNHHSEARNFSADRQGHTVSPLPYHPGAARYYQERGVIIRARE